MVSTPAQARPASLDRSLLSPAPHNLWFGGSGQPVLRFDGQVDGMYCNPSFQLNRPYTCFIVNRCWAKGGETKGRTLQSRATNWCLGLYAGQHGHYTGRWVGRGTCRTNAHSASHSKRSVQNTVPNTVPNTVLDIGSLAVGAKVLRGPHLNHI